MTSAPLQEKWHRSKAFRFYYSIFITQVCGYHKEKASEYKIPYERIQLPVFRVSRLPHSDMSVKNVFLIWEILLFLERYNKGVPQNLYLVATFAEKCSIR